MDLSPFENMQGDEDKDLTEKELENKYKDEKPFYCFAPWETPTIEENGKISPCLKPVREHNKEFYIGDLSKGDTIKEAWNSDKMNKLRELHSKGQWYKFQCVGYVLKLLVILNMKSLTQINKFLF